MIPVGPIVGALIWALRSRKGASASGGVRQSPTDGWTIVAIVVRLFALAFLLPGAAVLVNQLVGGGDPMTPAELATLTGMVAVSAVVSMPGAILRFVLIPMGLVRTAFWTHRLLLPFGSVYATYGGAGLAAVKALPNSSRREEMLEWLDVELTALKTVADGKHLLAIAGVVEARGGRQRAWALRHAAARLHGWRRRGVRREACLWLAADALERGAWDELLVVAHASPPRHEARLLAAALRARRDPRRSRARLVVRWLATGSRLALRRWLRWANEAPAPTEVPEAPLERAVALHARACGWGASASWDDVVAACEAWPAAQEELTARLGRRLAVHEAKSAPEECASRILSGAAGELCRAIDVLGVPRPKEKKGGPVPALPPLLQQARLAVVEARAEKLDDLAQSAVSAWRTEKRADRVGFWEAWGAYRVGYARLARVATDGEMSLAMRRHWPGLCNGAVTAVNVHGERLLAGSVFRFLETECKRLAVDADLKLLARNRRWCGE